MRKNIFAWTSAASVLPNFISVNVDERGEVLMTVRESGVTKDVTVPRDQLAGLAEALTKAAK